MLLEFWLLLVYAFQFLLVLFIFLPLWNCWYNFIQRIFKKVSLPMSVIIMTLITCGLFGILAFSASIAIFYVMLFMFCFYVLYLCYVFYFMFSCSVFMLCFYVRFFMLFFISCFMLCFLCYAFHVMLCIMFLYYIFYVVILH